MTKEKFTLKIKFDGVKICDTECKDLFDMDKLYENVRRKFK